MDSFILFNPTEYFQYFVLEYDQYDTQAQSWRWFINVFSNLFCLKLSLRYLSI